MVEAATAAGLALPLVAFWAFEVFGFGRRGQTIGRRVGGLYVVDSTSGQAVGRWRLLGRFAIWGVPLFGGAIAGGLTVIADEHGIVRALDAATLLGLVIPLSAFVLPGRLGLHDRLFHTRVLAAAPDKPKDPA